jgi:DASH complex subunit DAM1
MLLLNCALFDQQGVEEDARAALAALRNPPNVNADVDKTVMTETTEPEMTFEANTTTTTTATSGVSGKSATKVVKKKGAKPKLTAKEKKERNVSCVLLMSSAN